LKNVDLTPLVNKINTTIKSMISAGVVCSNTELEVANISRTRTLDTSSRIEDENESNHAIS
jgi:hypothetical protein